MKLNKSCRITLSRWTKIYADMDGVSESRNVISWRSYLGKHFALEIVVFLCAAIFPCFTTSLSSTQLFSCYWTLMTNVHLDPYFRILPNCDSPL